MEEMQPGQVISPRSESEPQADTQTSDLPTAHPERNEPPTGPAAAPPANPTVVPENTNNWQYKQETTLQDYPANTLPENVTWTASEFIEHQKSTKWYGILTLAGLALVVLVYLLTRDKTSTAIVVLAVVTFGIYAGRKPRTQSYDLRLEGLQAGNKLYDFQDFKSFSIIEEGAIVSIVFMPLKRFMPPLTIYVAPEMEEQVVDFLSQILPYERHKADAIDSLLRRIRF